MNTTSLNFMTKNLHMPILARGLSLGEGMTPPLKKAASFRRSEATEETAGYRAGNGLLRRNDGKNAVSLRIAGQARNDGHFDRLSDRTNDGKPVMGERYTV
jgi:hypothetical protein